MSHEYSAPSIQSQSPKILTAVHRTNSSTSNAKIQAPSKFAPTHAKEILKKSANIVIELKNLRDVLEHIPL
ncbi:MAG: hypothetical protein ACTTIC_08210 [Helicobacteraceae bacterium]